MPLSINPVVKSPPKSLGTGITASIGQLSGNLSTPGANGLKTNLDSTVNRISGGLGSGLNGMSAGIQKGISNLSSIVQSPIPLGGVGSLTSAVGSLSNIAGVAGALGSIASGGLGTGLKAAASLAGNLAAAGGMVNDFMSLARAKNLPKGGAGSGQSAGVVKVYPTREGDWRVRISAPLGMGEIIFPVLPTLSLGFKANYTGTELVHTNYQFWAYKNSQVDDISISCEWPVESVEDGKEYVQMVLLGRTLTKMFYGTGDNVGQPPPICTLKGYAAGSFPNILPDTPVVVKSFQIDLKDDVSYLQVGDDYVPRLSSMSITVTPVYSRTAQRDFNLEIYRQGRGDIRY